MEHRNVIRLRNINEHKRCSAIRQIYIQESINRQINQDLKRGQVNTIGKWKQSEEWSMAKQKCHNKITSNASYWEMRRGTEGICDIMWLLTKFTAGMFVKIVCEAHETNWSRSPHAHVCLSFNILKIYLLWFLTHGWTFLSCCLRLSERCKPSLRLLKRWSITAVHHHC